MKRAIFLILLVCQFSFAFINQNDDYEKEIKILRSLDIDASFVPTLHYISIKNSVEDKRLIRDYIGILKKGYAFIPTLQKMIEEAGVPTSFLYLAMAESNFSPKARSRRRAGGIWQFMPRTARKMGLKINKYIDERFDPVKSTKAAISYLQTLHQRFKKWYLVAIAYNCGEGKLAKAIKEAGTDDLSVLLDDERKYIPKESRDYIRKILTMAHIAENTDLIVKNSASFLLNRSKSDYLHKVTIKGGVNLKKLAKRCQLTYKEFKFYNPHIRKDLIPRKIKKCDIYLPYQKYIAYKQNGYLRYAQAKRVKHKRYKRKKRHIRYRVKKGDTLFHIARKFKTPVKKIKLANNMRTSFLKIGKSIVIPR